MGSEMCIRCSVDPRTRARVGMDIELVVNMENMHAFDRETEVAIR